MPKDTSPEMMQFDKEFAPELFDSEEQEKAMACYLDPKSYESKIKAFISANFLPKSVVREKIDEVVGLHRFSAWSPHDPKLELISKGSKDTADGIKADLSKELGL